MPKTSAFDHPKFEHSLTIHSWQLKACENNLFAAMTLAYLEDKFMLLLQAKDKQKGWLKLNKFQIKNAIFAESSNYVDSALDHLKLLNFIQLNPQNPDYPRGEEEVWVKLNFLEVNAWLEVYKDKKVKKIDLLNYAPFMMLALFMTPEPQIIEKTVEVVKEKIVAEREKLRPEDHPYVQRAAKLFEFWKWVTNHPKSNISDKYLRMIINRLKENYSDYQVAQAILGILSRKGQKDFEKYDTLNYIIKDSARLDMMVKDAEKMGFNIDKAGNEFYEFSKKFDSNEKIEPRSTVDIINPNTGSKLK